MEKSEDRSTKKGELREQKSEHSLYINCTYGRKLHAFINLDVSLSAAQISRQVWHFVGKLKSVWIHGASQQNQQLQFFQMQRKRLNKLVFKHTQHIP